MAFIFADSGKVNEALEIYQAAVNRFSKGQFEDEMAALRYNFGVLLKEAGKSDEATEQFRIAADCCRGILAKDPTSVDSYVLLGNISAENGDFEEAVKYFQKAVYFKPGDLTNNLDLIQALESQGRLEEAIEVSRQAIEYLLKNGQQQDAAKVQQYLQFLEFKKLQPQKQKK
jgi:tetratricopeptide (TPR) repeat protein